MAIDEPAIRPRGESEGIGAAGTGEDVREEVPLPVRMKRSWAEPAAEERERHPKYHCPFRAWCEFCVRGTCNNDGRYKQPAAPDGHPVISIDYAYMKSAQVEEQAGRPI